jgi:AraC family transcriptional activator of pobA
MDQSSNNLYYFYIRHFAHAASTMVLRPASPAPEVPQFALYGEDARAENGEFVHVELIETRSRQHDWHIGQHTHSGLFQVLFLFGGQVRATVNGAIRECRAPTALTIHPSVVHGFDFSEGIEGLLGNLLAELSWPHYGHTLMLEWLARSALLLLVRVQAENRLAVRSGHGELELFTRFRAVVEQHFRQQWQVGQYAAALRVTPTRLNRLCLKVAGKSAFDISQDRLVLEACRKLTYTPSGIASIAYELGFQDAAYFSRLFKKRLGLTPKQFRLQPTMQQLD